VLGRNSLDKNEAVGKQAGAVRTWAATTARPSSGWEACGSGPARWHYDRHTAGEHSSTVPCRSSRVVKCCCIVTCVFYIASYHLSLSISVLYCHFHLFPVVLETCSSHFCLQTSFPAVLCWPCPVHLWPVIFIVVLVCQCYHHFSVFVYFQCQFHYLLVFLHQIANSNH